MKVGATLANLRFIVASQEQYIARTDREIDDLVYQLYGLTDEEIRIVERG